jgi:hypothetical protein
MVGKQKKVWGWGGGEKVRQSLVKKIKEARYGQEKVLLTP